MELSRKQIHSDAKRMAPRAPRRRARACRLQNPPSGLESDRTIGERFDEACRPKQTSFRVLPAQQGFCPNHGTVANAQLRLIVKDELSLRERTPKVRVELAPCLRL